LAEANNVKQANRVNRAGILWSAVLRFAVNTDADNMDVATLTTDALSLNAPIPHVKLPRSKTSEYRETPLLPCTVAALKAWMDYAEIRDGLVFRNDQGKPFVSEKVWTGFERLRDALGKPELTQIDKDHAWSFKHIRNVGGNVAKRAGISIELREAFNGHAYNGMNQFYEEGFTFEAMIPIVNAIGSAYLDGQQVAQPANV